MSVTSPYSPAPIESWEVLDLLTGLVEKSLVVYEEDEQGHGRYRLLETVRQYGRSRLLEASEKERIQDRHLAFSLALVEEAEPKLRGPEQKQWSTRLQGEHDNLRAALEWAVTRDAGTALRLVGALWWFWYVRGPAREGRQWLERALSQDRRDPTPWRAKALCGAGYLAAEQGDLTMGRSRLEESLALWRTLGDLEGEAFSLGLLSQVVLSLDPMLAATQSEESVALARRSGSIWVLGFALLYGGEVARWQRDDSRAAELYAQSIALAREAGDDWLLCMPLHNLAHTLLHQGKSGQARDLFQESLVLSRDHEVGVGVAYCLAGLGGVAAAAEDPLRAARLLGAATEQFHTLGQKMQLVDQAEFDRIVAVARAQMDEAAFARAWADARALSLQQAIDYALEPEEGRT